MLRICTTNEPRQSQKQPNSDESPEVLTYCAIREKAAVAPSILTRMKAPLCAGAGLVLQALVGRPVLLLTNGQAT